MRQAISQIVATRFLLAGLSVVGGVLTARLLGSEGRGQYFLAQTITSTGVQMACLGLHTGNTYMVARNPDLLRLLSANNLFIAALVGTLAPIAVSAFYFAGLFPSLNVWLLLVACLGVSPILYQMLSVNLFLGIGNVSSFNRYELLARLVPILLILSFAWNPDPLRFLAAWVGGAYVVAVFIVFRSVPAGNRDLSLLRDTLRYGLRAYIVSLVGFLFSRLPIFILSQSKDLEGIGQLSIALQLADLMTILPATIGMSMFPELVRTPNRRHEVLTHLLPRLTGFMLVACLFAAVLADPLIPWVFGDVFQSAIGVFRCMLPGILFFAVISIISQVIAASGIPWLLVSCWIFGTISLLLFGLLLAPSFGAIGVAVAWSAASAIVLTCLLTLVLRSNLNSKSKF